MNLFLSIGTKIVVLALVAYSVAIFTEQRKRHVTNRVLLFLTAGVLLDITATAFMIAGSSNTPFTLHGILGYSSLLAMLIDASLLWRYRLAHGNDTPVARGLHLYSRLAYIWWVLAFITGGAIAAGRYI